jgi:hypothetical protein
MGGRAIGPYEVLSRLGGGGMAEISLAHDTRLGRPVALKLLPAHVTGDRDRLRRFQEARAAAAVNHPNVTHIYEIGAADGIHFIAMEFVEGQSLEVRMRDRSGDADGLVPVALQLVDALAEAHGHGITHRDIKPANIMITARGQVKVLDFGLAKIARPETGPPGGSTFAGTTPGLLMGTMAYMSPEQARGEPTSDATDIFSLGIVLYELPTGRHPFGAGSQIGTMNAIVSQPVLPPSTLNPLLPASLDALILQMLEKDSRLRPQCSEVRTVLAGLAGGGAALEPRPATAPARRHTVGRETERLELRAGHDAAAAGHGLLLCVAGEPGIGKTTLVEDFLHDVEVAGGRGRVGRGRCSERLAGTEAYLPILEALETLLRGEARESAARLLKLLAPTWYVLVAPLAAGESSLGRLITDVRAAPRSG